MLLLHIFAHTISNSKLLLHTDNETLVTILNKQSTKHAPPMVILREIVLTALRFNITFKSVHVLVVDNMLSDLHSHLLVDMLRSRAKNVDTNPKLIPDHLRPKNCKIT